MASTQEPEAVIEAVIEAQYENLKGQLAEIDRATRNLVAAIEAGTDPAIVNPRIAQLRAEREQLSLQVASLDAPDRLSPVDIDALLTELGGLAHVLGEATPPEKASIYQGLGLHLVYRPDQKALVATADLGRVFSRVGGGTLPGRPWALTHDNPRFSSPPATGRAVASLVGSLIWLLLAELCSSLTDDTADRPAARVPSPRAGRMVMRTQARPRVR